MTRRRALWMVPLVAGLTLWMVPLVAGLTLWIPPAHGQERDEVTLALETQSPWNTPKLDELDVRIAIRNDAATALEGAVVRPTLFAALPNRSEYLASLTSDPGVAQLRTLPDQRVDSLEPGETATVRIRERVDDLAEGAAEGRIYPLRLDLVLGEDILATLRTPVIFIPKEPRTPLETAWTFVLSYPTTYEPDEAFVGHGLERAIAPGGGLAARVAALKSLIATKAPHPIDLAIGPVLIRQLVLMEDGYQVLTPAGTEHVQAGQAGAADAAAMLHDLRRMAAAPRVKVSALPYASPSLPRLLASGLAQDLPAQIRLGQDAIDTELQTDADRSTLYPPGSAVDDRTIARIRAQGIGTLLVEAGTVEQPRQEKGFAPPPAARLPAGGQATIDVVVPDAGTQALIASPAFRDDPRLRTQAVLGDLAAIWLEEPDVDRGVALLIPGEAGPEAGFFGPFTRTISTAPWLATIPSGKAARFIEPDERARLNPAHPEPFPDDYLASLRESRELIEAYRSILVDPGAMTLPAELELDTLTTEENALVNSKRGPRWLSWIHGQISEVLAGVRADASQVFTLTSRVGTIPVRLTNDSGHDVDVRVRLVSTRLRSTGENPMRVRLGTDPLPVSFPVEAQATGTFPAQVVIETPQGRVINTTSIVIRSTAYSRIAVIIMATAGAVLVALWARRLLSMRKG
ncbi:MAG: DUF6049 family protein [Actinomycetota bacterium]